MGSKDRVTVHTEGTLIMIDVFELKVYWKDRHENIDSLSRRLVLLFEGLKAKNSFFSTWSLKSTSKKLALETTFPSGIQEIRELLASSVKPAEIDSKGYSALGFQIGLYKIDDEDNDYGLSFFGGYGGSLFPNNCIVSFWNPHKFRKDEFLDLFRAVVLHLEPEDGCITSDGLSNIINEFDNQYGWITLSNKELIHPEFVSEKLDNGKYLIYLTGENLFDEMRIKNIASVPNLLK